MTLQELTSDDLKSLQDLSGSKVLIKLLESRMEEIKSDDFATKVVDTEGMLRREYNRGLYDGFKAVVSLEGAIKEEYDMREKEEDLARVSKR